MRVTGSSSLVAGRHSASPPISRSCLPNSGMACGAGIRVIQVMGDILSNAVQGELVDDNATVRPGPRRFVTHLAAFVAADRGMRNAEWGRKVSAVRPTVVAGRRNVRSVRGSVASLKTQRHRRRLNVTEDLRKADRGRAALRHLEDQSGRHRDPASAEPRAQDGQEFRRASPRVSVSGRTPRPVRRRRTSCTTAPSSTASSAAS